MSAPEECTPIIATRYSHRTTERRAMTREELYALVWQTPLSRLSKRFGLSDVGLRKICVRHGIPTPPLGYWAKRAHGKKVHQPPLPPLDPGGRDTVHLVVRSEPEMPDDVAAAQDAALARELGRTSIMVPAKRPARFHAVAAATARSLRAARVDAEGFKHGAVTGGVDVRISPGSVDRALRIVDAFVRATVERGHGLDEDRQGIRIVVEGIPFAWRLYETRDRRVHQPTAKELRTQSRLDEDRARWPERYAYRGNWQCYPSWDYFPSGRLTMLFIDTTRPGWVGGAVIGRWRDRKNKRLEDYLDDAMAALVSGAIAVRYRLAEEAEEERRRAEEAARIRHEAARQERALKRYEFMLEKAEEFGRVEALVQLAGYLEREVYQHSDELVDRFVSELRSRVELMRECFERRSLQAEIIRRQLYTEEDAVADPKEEASIQQTS